MELKGKTLLFLGDSITAGSGVSGKEETYWYRLGQKTCASCIGYGVGGTRIAEQQPDGFEALGNFCTRAQQMQKKGRRHYCFWRHQRLRPRRRPAWHPAGPHAQNLLRRAAHPYFVPVKRLPHSTNCVFNAAAPRRGGRPPLQRARRTVLSRSKQLLRKFFIHKQENRAGESIFYAFPARFSC